MYLNGKTKRTGHGQNIPEAQKEEIMKKQEHSCNNQHTSKEDVEPPWNGQQTKTSRGGGGA